jgi:proteasome lid subunit RPN8/RPN11
MSRQRKSLRISNRNDQPIGEEDDFIVEQVYGIPAEEQPLYTEFCYQPGESFQVYIQREALNVAYVHALRGFNDNQEVAGVLVGRLLRDSVRQVEYIEVSHILEAHSQNVSSIEVNIPPEEWFRLTGEIERNPLYRGQYVVGWYHSHPRMNAFMSEIDQRTQAQHFHHKGQVAIVIGIGVGRPHVRCYDHESREVSLYFLPEPKDRHLTRAIPDRIPGRGHHHIQR